MTRVDFYLATDETPRAAGVLACRVAEKAWKSGHKVYVHAENPTHAQKLDELLWTFRDVSFVPHALAGSEDDDIAVVIGHDAPPPEYKQILVNTTGQVPKFFKEFERVAEIVGGDEDSKKAGRARFKKYRDQGLEPETHEI